MLPPSSSPDFVSDSGVFPMAGRKSTKMVKIANGRGIESLQSLVLVIILRYETLNKMCR